MWGTQDSSTSDELGRTRGGERTGVALVAPAGARKRRRRNAFETTVTDDKAIAAAAKIGSSSQPVIG